MPASPIGYAVVKVRGQDYGIEAVIHGNIGDIHGLTEYAAAQSAAAALTQASDEGASYGVAEVTPSGSFDCSDAVTWNPA